MTHQVSYGDIADALDRGDLPGSTAEMHGLLAGMLCMDTGVDRRQWLVDFFGEAAGRLESHALDDLNRLFEQTRRQFVDFDFSFALLLPGDDDPPRWRAQALGEWCHGFLQGIGYKGPESRWPGECTEILGDLLEIVRLDTIMKDESDEAALTELTEYVRVAVQVIHSELQFQDHPRLH